MAAGLHIKAWLTNVFNFVNKEAQKILGSHVNGFTFVDEVTILAFRIIVSLFVCNYTLLVTTI